MVQASELSIDTGASATEMAQTIFGDGVTVVSATYSGSGYSSGTYSGGDTTSPGVTPGDTGVILSTGRARDFTNSSGAGQPGYQYVDQHRGPEQQPGFQRGCGCAHL